MIVQKYNQGENEIRVEAAESLDDAIKNGFKENEHVRYFVNGKLTNYFTMIQFMVGETQKNKEKFIPHEKDLMKLRNKMILTQKEEMRKNLNELKKTYKDINIPEHVLNNIDNSIEKINQIGLRVKK